MPTQSHTIATESLPDDTMEGHDAPMLSPTFISRPEEGMQHDSGAEYSIEYAETQQAPSPYPQLNDPRQDSIRWSTHLRNQDAQASLVQSSNSRRESFPWDPSQSSIDAQRVPPSVVRHLTNTTMSTHSQNTPPRGAILPGPAHPCELDARVINGSNTDVAPDAPPSSEDSETSIRVSRWQSKPYLRWADPQHKYWRYISPTLTVCLLAVLIAIIVLYLHTKKNDIAPLKLAITIAQQATALPMIDSALAAAKIVWGSYFTTLSASGSPHNTKLVYTTGSGAICIRTKTFGSWLSSIQCITNLSPKPHTPLAVLDWLGGPSIYC